MEKSELTISKKQMTPQEKFLTMVRTLMVMTMRLKNATEMEAVHIPSTEIDKVFPYPEYHRKEEIKKLVDSGNIIISQKGKAFFYEVTTPGNIDLSLLQKRDIPNDSLVQHIYKNLQRVSLPKDVERTNFFNLFLSHQKTAPYLFFTVDEFCSRIHTPISGLHRTIRPYLLLDGQPTTSIDITTAQPLFLASILEKAIGNNELSDWVNDGKDVYLLMMEKAKITERDAAKKAFLKMLFSPDLDFIERTFGKSNWADWIKKYKSEPDLNNRKPKTENKNPHYNNLAFLLQSTEVKIMRKVWRRLKHEDIVFLTVHDSVIIKQSDQARAFEIFSEVMAAEFPKYYHLHTEGIAKETPSKPILPPSLIELQKQYSQLEQEGKIAEQHHDRVRRLWGNVKDCLRNKRVGINKAILELNEFKNLLVN